MKDGFLFYVAEMQEIQKTIALSEQEVSHCIKVLRKQLGDSIYVTNGSGKIAEAEIVEIGKKSVNVKPIKFIIEKESRADNHLHIYIAPTKNISRFEWFLEKATEIGVDEITPVICTHSERRHIRNERLEKVILSAAKQSFSAFLPQLHTAVKLTDVLKAEKLENAYFAICDEKKNLLAKSISKGQSLRLFIGPEGDFSIDEVNAFKEKNVVSVSLGENRLRTETAGIVAVDTVSLINQI